MQRLAILALFVALVASAPTSKESQSSESKEDEKLVIDASFFPDDLKIYTSEYDIVNLIYPLNGLNFDDDDAEAEDSDEDKKIIFFVEADGDVNKGVSVYNTRNVTKILPTGTSIATDIDDVKTAFFGATDGLYQYNAAENKAEKYGPITDSIIDIAKANGTDLLYILTDKNELFKVTENGTKKEKVDVVGAKQIVLDYSNNVYYYGADKKPYVLTEDGVKAIEGLPSDPDYIKLLKPAFVIEDGVPIILDEKAYIIYANGTSWFSEIEFKTKPSAYAMEGTLLQYYAYKKSIYEYNVVTLLLTEAVKDLKTYFDGKEDEIQQLATRSRSDFAA